jgi:hypothetical protein
MLPEAASPIPPQIAADMSVKISPNRLSDTTTQNALGYLQRTLQQRQREDNQLKLLEIP